MLGWDELPWPDEGETREQEPRRTTVVVASCTERARATRARIAILSGGGPDDACSVSSHVSRVVRCTRIGSLHTGPGKVGTFRIGAPCPAVGFAAVDGDGIAFCAGCCDDRTRAGAGVLHQVRDLHPPARTLGRVVGERDIEAREVGHLDDAVGLPARAERHRRAARRVPEIRAATVGTVEEHRARVRAGHFVVDSTPRSESATGVSVPLIWL